MTQHQDTKSSYTFQTEIEKNCCALSRVTRYSHKNIIDKWVFSSLRKKIHVNFQWPKQGLWKTCTSPYKLPCNFVGSVLIAKSHIFSQMAVWGWIWWERPDLMGFTFMDSSSYTWQPDFLWKFNLKDIFVWYDLFEIVDLKPLKGFDSIW